MADKTPAEIWEGLNPNEQTALLQIYLTPGARGFRLASLRRKGLVQRGSRAPTPAGNAAAAWGDSHRKAFQASRKAGA